MKRRLGHPATRAVAPGKKRGFSPALATYGGGHIHVPKAVLDEAKFHSRGRE
jgi:hypothetical protein